MSEFPQPRDLLEKLRVEIRRFGTGGWRITEDLLDTVYDKLVDLSLRNPTPSNSLRWNAYARTVLHNLVRSGPPRAALDRRRVEQLHELPAEQHDSAAGSSNPLRDLTTRPSLLTLLTPAEQRAVLAVLGSSSIAQAAKLAGMTRRDLRVRLRRVAAKSRGSAR